MSRIRLEQTGLIVTLQKLDNLEVEMDRLRANLTLNDERLSMCANRVQQLTAKGFETRNQPIILAGKDLEILSPSGAQRVEMTENDVCAKILKIMSKDLADNAQYAQDMPLVCAQYKGTLLAMEKQLTDFIEDKKKLLLPAN